MTKDCRADHDTAHGAIQAHQQAWEDFATGTVRMLPVLKAHINAVTQETERAAMELMVHLRLLAAGETTTSHEGAASVSQVVMAMQFQDITRQKLEHVNLALDQLGCHLRALLKGPHDEAAKREIAALQEVEQHYTMEEERRLHQATLQPDYQEPVPTDVSNKEIDSVTLF
ncbi:MAG: hypothetical protein A4E19_16035 [Nitrospira sp. SG-bin1]|nr:MAG: hypothetical protein A4E19_16035 [Nitrospira sp. SG-bin1]